MKRLASIAGAALIAAVLLPSPAAAASVSASLRVVLNDQATDAFLCGEGAAICNLYHRIYADVDPTLPNGNPAQFRIDGWPIFRSGPLNYVGDSNLSTNWGAAIDNEECEGWYGIHAAVLNPGAGTFISYQTSQSQIVNVGDTGGDSRFADCREGDGRNTDTCFGAVGTAQAGPGSAGTPSGNLGPVGGLTPVPVPTVTTSDTAGGTLGVEWPAVVPGNTLNLPSLFGEQAPCDPATTTFDDLTERNGPNPVWGVGLFVHTIPDSGPFRSLASLEGGSVDASGILDILTNVGERLACDGTGTDPNCPGVHQIACNAVLGVTTCVGDGTLFAPLAQSFTLSQAIVDAALGADGPLDGTNNAVLNTKVFYRGSVEDSIAALESRRISGPNPSLVSLFSANSSRISFGTLVSSVVFDGEPVVEGNRVTLSWSTIGGPFIEFRVQRADDGVSFTELGTVAATGADSYQFTDTFRGRRPSSATYRLIVVEPSGESQILTTVDLSPGSRSPRR